MKKIFLILGIILAVALVSATVYPEAWGNDVDAGDHNIDNVNNITAVNFLGTLIGTFTGTITGDINASQVINPASACPGSSAITSFGNNLSVVTCSDLWVDEAGDTMTGDLIIDGTAMLQLQSNSTTAVCNSTNVGYIYYNGDLNKHYGCNSTGWNGMY